MAILYIALVTIWIMRTINWELIVQVMEWFKNYVVLNIYNCHYMCLSKDTENANFHFMMGILKLIVKKTKCSILSKTVFYLIVISKSVLKSFTKISSVISISELFRTGRKKINFHLHNKIIVYILPFSYGCTFLEHQTF